MAPSGKAGEVVLGKGHLSAGRADVALAPDGQHQRAVRGRHRDHRRGARRHVDVEQRHVRIGIDGRTHLAQGTGDDPHPGTVTESDDGDLGGVEMEQPGRPVLDGGGQIDEELQTLPGGGWPSRHLLVEQP